LTEASAEDPCGKKRSLRVAKKQDVANQQGIWFITDVFRRSCWEMAWAQPRKVFIRLAKRRLRFEATIEVDPLGAYITYKRKAHWFADAWHSFRYGLAWRQSKAEKEGENY
jgi:hypothetical protein